MEVVEKNKGRKSLISKTWELCRSVSNRSAGNKSPLSSMLKSRSWPRSLNSPGESIRRRHNTCSSSSSKRRQVAPEGYFAVYVGPQRERFVMKMKYANHPLFKMLLEETEEQYGYNSQGPLVLACDVDYFYEILSEMNCDGYARQGCSFAKRNRSYRLLSPSRMMTVKDF